jgi:hypothetical protein
MRPLQNKKYHYVYKITNRFNGMEYIGVHSTDNLAKSITLCYNNLKHRVAAIRELDNLYQRGILGTGIKYKAA